MAFFGVDIWNPMNVGSHSTDEQWSNQFIITYKLYTICKGGNVYGYKINIKVSGKIEGATSETSAHCDSIMKKCIKNNMIKINKNKNKVRIK